MVNYKKIITLSPLYFSSSSSPPLFIPLPNPNFQISSHLLNSSSILVKSSVYYTHSTMEGSNGMSNAVRKKRSLTIRRPRAEGSSSLLAVSNDDDVPVFDTNPRRKEFSLSQCISRAESIVVSERGNNDSRRREIIARNKRSTEGVLAPASWKNSRREREEEGNDGMVNGRLEGAMKKLKLKIGGVSRPVSTNGSSRKSLKPVNEITRANNDLQESSEEDSDSPIDKKSDFESPEKDGSMPPRRKQGEAARKSKRTPKKRAFDSDDDNDDEIQFLEKLKYRNVNGESSGKRVTEEMDDAEESESLADEKEIGGNEDKRETSLTSRQRALASATGRSTVIEFPDGLPPTTRKKKEILSATEQQLKKTEAAQRRKAQVEKNARESEAEAIRKILGQDSSRKKREDKIKKRLDELAQEKAKHEEMAPTNCIRTIMGPNGTTVSFPLDKVPSIFNPKPAGYPPPRENCAGPSCTNPYKYRDSKTKVPLCSLKCYKAVQGQQPAVQEQQPAAQEQKPAVQEQQPAAQEQQQTAPI